MGPQVQHAHFVSSQQLAPNFFGPRCQPGARKLPNAGSPADVAGRFQRAEKNLQRMQKMVVQGNDCRQIARDPNTWDVVI